jgi:hypothetical protein
MNPIEVISSVFKPFLDGKKSPPNTLEVGNLWMYMAIAENSLRNEQVAFNTVEDTELKKKLQQAADDVHNPIMMDIKKFFLHEGIPLTDPSADKPFTNLRNVHEGAKLTDFEIANLMSFNILIGSTFAMRGLTESIRADIQYIYSKAMMRKVTFSAPLKDLMIRKKWIQVPPYYKV